MTVPLLQCSGITKQFGSFIALDHVNVSFYAGEIHAILGENGAGKSTLMKVLYGVYVPDEGVLKWEGTNVQLHPPAQARAHGVGMVFQDFRLIPALTVLENVALGMDGMGPRIRRENIRTKMSELQERYGIAVNTASYVWELDLGQQQRVEICKALLGGHPKLIIFDEPTSVLTPIEVEGFLSMLRKLRDDGFAVVLITHKISEVTACADRVTVLRQGKVTFQAARDERAPFREDVLIREMIGNQKMPEPLAHEVKTNQELPVFQLADVTLLNDHGKPILSHINFEIHPGEIVGVAGISGNGQLELAESAYGLRVPKQGKVFIDGADMTGKAVKAWIEKGYSYIPEDPVQESIISGLTILEHMVLTGIAVPYTKLGINWQAAERSVRALPEYRRLSVADPKRRADQLSGGNIQRMVLARAMSRKPKLLIVSYPTRGLDVVTTRETQNLLLELRNQGTSILLITENLTELYELSDRMYVLSHQKVLGPYDPRVVNAQELGQLMLKGGEAS